MKPLIELGAGEILMLRAAKCDYFNALLRHYGDYDEEQLAELAIRQPRTREFIKDYVEGSPALNLRKYESSLTDKLAGLLTEAARDWLSQGPAVPQTSGDGH